MFPSPTQHSPCRRLLALQKNEPEAPGWTPGRRWPWATHFVYVTQPPSGGAGIAAKGLATLQNRQHHSAPSPRPVGISLPKACSCRSRRAAEGKPNQRAGKHTHPASQSRKIPHASGHMPLSIFLGRYGIMNSTPWVWVACVGCGMRGTDRQTHTNQCASKQKKKHKSLLHFRPVYPLYVAPSINPPSLSRADFRPSAWMASMDGPRKRNKRKNR